MDTILADTKELLNIPAETTSFDNQLIMYINSVFVVLSSLGVGPSTPHIIESDTVLEDLFPDDLELLSMIQMYIYTKTRLLFDPPQSSFVLESLATVVSEYEYRLREYAESEV